LAGFFDTGISKKGSVIKTSFASSSRIPPSASVSNGVRTHSIMNGQLPAKVNLENVK